ncbi:hypothetical protein B0178_07095 [Streptococcus pseudopneumoniae]|nr:hypothetical protein B0178_07095 [Streptococcus pseudopneumoniae]
MILRRLERLQFKPELPFSSEFLEKFSARVQIKTRALPFFFIFYIEKDTKPVKKQRENRSGAQ